MKAVRRVWTEAWWFGGDNREAGGEKVCRAQAPFIGDVLAVPSKTLVGRIRPRFGMGGPWDKEIDRAGPDGGRPGGGELRAE